MGIKVSKNLLSDLVTNVLLLDSKLNNVYLKTCNCKSIGHTRSYFFNWVIISKIWIEYIRKKPNNANQDIVTQVQY